MQDPRTLATLHLATALVTSGNPNYATRTIGEVAAELLGIADDIDHDLSGCNCDDDEDGGGGGPVVEPVLH